MPKFQIMKYKTRTRPRVRIPFRRAVLLSHCVLLCAVIGFAQAKPDPSQPASALGSLGFKPTPEHPVGWRGDWTGRFPGATPPLEWSRRVKGITSEIKYQAAKPSGQPGPGSFPLEYFTLKEWLVAGPFPADDPVREIDKDFLNGEETIEPNEGDKAGEATWEHLRAGIETQSRHY